MQRISPGFISDNVQGWIWDQEPEGIYTVYFLIYTILGFYSHIQFCWECMSDYIIVYEIMQMLWNIYVYIYFLF